MHARLKNSAGAIAAALSLVLAIGSAEARGHLQTRQTGIELPAGTRAGRLVLANTGDARLAAQIRVYAWTQDGNEDQLNPSTDLMASPPIVEIAADAEQLVRLVRPADGPVAREQAYRVVVDELPGDPGATEGSAVAVRMRFLIPVFVRATDPAPIALECRLEAAALACRNTGGRAAQLGATSMTDAAGHKVEVTSGLLGYVLANSARRFPLESDKVAQLGSGLKLQVMLNGEPVTLDLAR